MSHTPYKDPKKAQMWSRREEQRFYYHNFPLFGSFLEPRL